MSLSRQIFREFRPIFRMLDEPFNVHYYPSAVGRLRGRGWEDPIFGGALSSAHVPVDISEDGNHYIIEAELPGIKRENVDVRVEDGGQMVTIEGRIVQSSARSAPESAENSAAPEESEQTHPAK
jgi:HSP20 family molecular chaperone IbpA